ncbi:hypothetical protein TL16_g12026 [Triparma laevis f. inornata]|uniref:Uncharacterized protein n=1 Tax=Triparma laevis f. inornata TaxID=1714386 RepID=A0A9W7BHP5_9STRA|nr:hypothetical protein TL16_g12026 [Triparma laevis f. inornata]
MKVSPPRTPACRFSRVSGGWQSDDSDSENDDTVGPPAEAKDDIDNSDNDDNPHKNLNWKSERLLSIDDENDLKNDIENDTPEESKPSSSYASGSYENLSQGLLPGTNVIIKLTNLKAKILRKSLFHGQLRYLVKLHSSGLESEHESNEIEISEPPLGWTVKWSENDVSNEDAGTVSEFSGLVIGASWFREVKRVEVELGDNNTVWKDFDNVRFIEPCDGTRVAVNWEGTDGVERVRSGIIEGRANFRNESRFQVKFDDGGDDWVDLEKFISPNEFRNL